MIRSFILLIIGVLLSSGLVAQEKFSFAFFTDIHLNTSPQRRSAEGLRQAIRHVESTEADFVLTGGDNVDVDGMKADQAERAKALYQEFEALTSKAKIPFYYTIGNHDRYWAGGSGAGKYGEQLFESFLGKTNYSFEHKGWLFIVLNSVQVCDGQYCIDDTQRQWLADLLAKTPGDQPIVVSAHVPFLSLYYPVLEGRYTGTDTFVNQKQIFDMFEGHNLKLVLQGHQHLYEEIKVKGVQFITAGAVSANWWGGSFHGTEEGYLLVRVDGDQFSWEYVDYGWEISEKQ